jgi:hypothetical protein
VPRIDGAELLTDVHDWLGRFIVTTTDNDLDLLALWAAHTHLVEETFTTPRLQIDSPIPECGKTTVLEHLHRLCRRPVQMAVVSSSAVIVRMIDIEIRTLLIDEADRSLKKDRPGIEDLYGVLNSGYKLGATRPVLVKGKGDDWAPREMSTFAPVALAGNQPALPDDTRSRILRVLLLPDFAGNAEESDWELIEAEAKGLGNQLATWADQVRDEVRKSRPTMPKGIIGRFREKWQPLRKVADAAGGRWPGIADELALQDKAEHDDSKEAGLITDKPGVVLLRHLYELWPDALDFWPTLLLVPTLVAEHPSMWGEQSSYGRELTPQRMGQMLVSNYRIESKRQGHGTPRGYYRNHLTKAWQSMGISLQTGSSGWSGDSGSGSGEPDSPEQPHEPVHKGTCPDWQNCDNGNCRAFQGCVR